MIPTRLRRRLRASQPPWVVAEPNPGHPEPLGHFAFYAVVGTWMEADVIADTVANAFAQGVERVFLADNASPDDTVTRAVAAGAEHMITFHAERYDERYRIALMNEVVHHVSTASSHDHVWWLWLDADEFPRPQRGGALREYLTSLDRRFRVVGARFLNHYPTPGQPAHVPGTHPLDHQPLCEELPLNICGELHRKHPLQRWDRNGARIDAGLGFHRAECRERPLFEPTEPIVVHHFPFREESTTRRRMDTLWSRADGSAPRARFGDVATDHMEARLKSLDAVYAGRWTEVHTFMPGAPEQGVTLVDWRDLTPSISPDLVRWTDAQH